MSEPQGLTGLMVWADVPFLQKEPDRIHEWLSYADLVCSLYGWRVPRDKQKIVAEVLRRIEEDDHV